MERESGTTVFLDKLTFPIVVGPPPACGFIAVQEHNSPLVTPKEINGRLIWFLRRRIAVNNGSVLIRVFTQDGRALGSSKVRFSDFQGRHVAKFSVKQTPQAERMLPVAENVTMDFHLEFLAKQTAEQTTKKVYIIRHAESRWNEAEGRNWWDKALSEVDHGISATGLEQSLKLRESLAKVVPSNSHIALVSPHRRTLQTALIATRTLRIHLDPRMREFTAGPDGHANTVGEQICERAKEELRNLGVQRLSSAMVDFSAVQESWWSHRFESTKKVDIRIKDFLRDLQYLPEEQIIIVGHSRWFKRMFNISYAGAKGHRKSSGAQLGTCSDSSKVLSSSSTTEPRLSTLKTVLGKFPSPRINVKPSTSLDLMNMDTDLLGIRPQQDRQPVRPDAKNVLNVDLLNLDAPQAFPSSASSPMLSMSPRSGPDEDDDGPAEDDEDSESDNPDSTSEVPIPGVTREELGRQSEIRRALRHCKLPNCGCVSIEFLWDGTQLPQISDAEIIHGEIDPSDSDGRKKNDKENCVIL